MAKKIHMNDKRGFSPMTKCDIQHWGVMESDGRVVRRWDRVTCKNCLRHRPRRG